MEVRYITLKPPEQVAMTMVEGPPFFRQFSGAWLFKALSPRRTRVTFRYHFATRPSLLGPVLDPVIGKVLTRDMEKRLAGLKTSARPPASWSASGSPARSGGGRATQRRDPVECRAMERLQVSVEEGYARWAAGYDAHPNAPDRGGGAARAVPRGPGAGEAGARRRARHWPARILR
jgi:hypothetical protein